LFLLHDYPTQSLSEIKTNTGQGRALLQAQWGGLGVESANLDSIDQVLKDASRVFDSSLEYENQYAFRNWSTGKWSQGSRPYFLAGVVQPQQLNHAEHSVFHAGDWASFWNFGTMNGAVETAQAAAGALKKSLTA